MTRNAFAAVLCGLCWSGLAALTPALAAAPLPPAQRTIAMTGQGAVSAMPDQANVFAGVVTHARTAGAALAANREAMNRVFDALAALGIKHGAIQTANFGLDPEYPPVDPINPRPREINGYAVSNSVNVTLDDVTQTGVVLDALIAAGANQSAGVSFSVKNPHPLEVAARADAAKDALERAQIYAQAVGAALGPVLSIREGSTATYGGAVETVVVTADRATPIAAGAQTVDAEVTVVWALK